MRVGDRIEIRRDCEATLVPSGTKQPLPAGAKVRIAQIAEGVVTVETELGALVQLDGASRDALGAAPSSDETATAGATPETPTAGTAPAGEADVWATLRSCFDPEIPVNIVELGLIYEVTVAPRPQGGRLATVVMTLTAPGCAMSELLRDDIRRKVSALADIDAVDVRITFDPPWDPGMMSDAAKLDLGMM